MNKMGIDLSTGNLTINNQSLTVRNYDDFVNTDFFNFFEKDLNKLGQYFFSLNDVKWAGESFSLEIRPSVNGFDSIVFLSRNRKKNERILKDNMNISSLYDEESHLVMWLRKILKRKEVVSFSLPSRKAWDYAWGSLVVQTNERSLSCGIYIIFSHNL